MLGSIPPLATIQVFRSRVPGYEPGGREFDSLRARHLGLTGHVVREARRPLGSYRAIDMRLFATVAAVQEFHPSLFPSELPP